MVVESISNYGHMLRPKFRGPRRATLANPDIIFEVQDFIKQTHALVHGNHLRFFVDSDADVSEYLLESITDNDPQLQTLMSLLGLRFNATADQCEVKDL